MCSIMQTEQDYKSLILNVETFINHNTYIKKTITTKIFKADGNLMIQLI